LVGTSIVLLALNLRALVASLGVVLETARTDLGISPTVAGVLTTLPVVCFGVAGLAASGPVRRIGLHRSVVALLALVVLGLVLRATTSSAALFIAATALALVGAAVGNVVLPPLAKQHFPDRLPLISSLYGAAIMGGAALASFTTVPIADALGGWRSGLVVWAGLAGLTLLPWLLLARHRVTAPTSPPVAYRSLLRSPTAWALTGTFGVQSAQAYAQFGWFPAILVDAGLSEAHAGAMLGLLTLIGLPLTLSLPWLMGRAGDRPLLPWFFAAATVAGWTGVLVAPSTATWAWAVLLGLGGGAFTWTLTMIGQRATSAESTTALSGFTQGVGYLLAGLGPFGAGALHDLTGGWTVPVAVLLVAGVGIGVLGSAVMRAAPVD
jgi:CP family cyanate transporter-like MFS transporter